MVSIISHCRIRARQVCQTLQQSKDCQKVWALLNTLVNDHQRGVEQQEANLTWLACILRLSQGMHAELRGCYIKEAGTYKAGLQAHVLQHGYPDICPAGEVHYCIPIMDERQ